VHIYYNEGKSRRLLGRYRIPSLEPVFPREPELSRTEERLLRGWLSQPEQVRKLQRCLEDTLFDMHKLADIAPRFADIAAEDVRPTLSFAYQWLDGSAEPRGVALKSLEQTA